jgi:phage tail tube protein FII
MNKNKKHKKGDARLNDDGSVSIFMTYQRDCHNGEYWVSVDKYNDLQNKQVEQKRESDRNNIHYHWDKGLV